MPIAAVVVPAAAPFVGARDRRHGSHDGAERGGAHGVGEAAEGSTQAERDAGEVSDISAFGTN